MVLGYAVKTLESKETKASKEITITHNSVFAAHRLQCRMTIRKIDIRHFAFSKRLSLGLFCVLALGGSHYRLSSHTQFVSQVLPPSAENDCSIRADFGEKFSQT